MDTHWLSRRAGNSRPIRRSTGWTASVELHVEDVLVSAVTPLRARPSHRGMPGLRPGTSWKSASSFGALVSILGFISSARPEYRREAIPREGESLPQGETAFDNHFAYVTSGAGIVNVQRPYHLVDLYKY
jgi:hypothetical protein